MSNKTTIYLNDGSIIEGINPIKSEIPPGCTDVYMLGINYEGRFLLEIIPLRSIKRITVESQED